MQTEIFLQAPTCGPREAGAKLADCLRYLQGTKTFGFVQECGYPQQRVIPVPVDNPPEDFPALRGHARALRPERGAVHIQVWAGGTENTIYPRHGDNHLFRALHDAYHVELNSGFDLAGELRVSLTMYEDLRLRGMQDAPALVYLIDTLGQSLMHFRKGEHASDQLAFVTSIWDRMLTKMRWEPIRVSILPLLQETVLNLAKE